MTKLAFVAGAAHFDVVAREQEVKPGQPRQAQVLDKPGTVTFTLGGAGCNLAVDLARLGLSARFFTAMGAGPYEDLVRRALQDAGVETHIETVPGMPPGLFSAHLDAHGELLDSITATPVQHHRFSAAAIREAMQGAAVAVIDTNLSGAMLDTMVAVANSLKIPIYVLSAADVKTPRVLQIKGRMAGLFLNRYEHRYLVQACFPSHTRYEEVAHALHTTLCLTRDADGTAIVTPTGVEMLPAPAKPFRGNALGAGDALAAGVVYYREIHKDSWAVAVRKATELAREILGRDGCNVATQ